MFIELCFTLSLGASASFLADGPPGGAGAPPRAGRPLPVSIEFKERSLLDAEKSPEGERRAILDSRGTLRTERPIRYRTVTLPAGSYPILVQRDEEGAGERNYIFLIGPAVEGSSAARRSGERGSGERGSGERGAATPAPEGKKEESIEIKKGEENDDHSEKKKGRAARAKKSQATDRIRALFHFSAAARSTTGVEYSVKPSAKGDRFTLTVRAGASQGKATLRFADVKS